MKVVPGSKLTGLAARINEEHRLCLEAATSALEHARAAGLLLIEAKAKVAHGGWLPWLQANVPFGERTAQNYMRLAREWPKLAEANPQRAAGLSYREAVKLLEAPRGGGGAQDGARDPDSDPAAVHLADLPPTPAERREVEGLVADLRALADAVPGEAKLDEAELNVTTRIMGVLLDHTRWNFRSWSSCRKFQLLNDAYLEEHRAGGRAQKGA
jgi:hypothetical protein